MLEENIVSFTSDGTSVMLSEGRGVSGLLHRSYNTSIFTQHCIVHRQALAATNRLQKLPSNVQTTVDDIMRHLKNSLVRKEKLRVIIEMSDENHE